MKPENEIRIFGYVDPCSPTPGSWKAEVFGIIEQAETSNDPNLASYIEKFAASVSRMEIYRRNVMSKFQFIQESKNRGKRLEELVKGSLDYQRYEVESAFLSQFPSNETHYFNVWEIFTDHIVVSERIFIPDSSVRNPLKDDEFFRVDFTRQGETISFQPRNEWAVVETAYRPKTMQESVWLMESSSNGARKIRIKNLMTANVINGNNRLYPTEVLRAAVEEVKTHLHESAGQGRLMLLGEVEHPSDKGSRRANLMETVIRWTDVEFDGQHVNATGLLATETEGGKHIEALAAIGVVPGGSIRGYGLTENIKVGERAFEKVTELHYTGIDVVTEASFSDSQTILESTGTNSPAEDKKMNLLEKLLALLKGRPDLFKGVSESTLRAMTEAQLETLWSKIDEAMGIDTSKIGVSEALTEMVDKARKFDEGQKKGAIESAIAEAMKGLPYGDHNAQFEEALRAAQPASPEAVKAIAESQRKIFDGLFSAKALAAKGGGSGVSGVQPVIESEGVPEYARVSFGLTESLRRADLRARRDLRKAETPAEVFTAMLLEKFDKANQNALIAEAKAFQEASTTADLSLPYSVSRAIIEEVFPTLVSANIFDFGVMTTSPERMYYEVFAGETGYAGTVSKEDVTADLNAWVELDYKRVTPGTVVVTNSAENVTYAENSDYLVDYANGLIMAIATITDEQALKVSYGYTAIRKGEMAPIERGKLTMTYKTIEAVADRLADQISREAVVFSQSQLGFDIVSRTLASLIRQTRRKIDQGILYLGYSIVGTIANNSGGTWTIGTSQSDLDSLVRLLGLAKVKVANRYYEPNFILASYTNAERLSNWDGFKRDGWPTAILNAAGYAGTVKNLPIFASTEFPDDKIVVGNRQLVMHRVMQPLQIRGPFPSYHTDGKLIAADQYYTEEFNATDAPVAQKGAFVLVEEAGS